MRFKYWLAQFLEDAFPGTMDHTRTADVTNTNMGVASRYQGTGETGERAANHSKTKIADYGQKSLKGKARSDFWRNINVKSQTPSNYFPT